MGPCSLTIGSTAVLSLSPQHAHFRAAKSGNADKVTQRLLKEIMCLSQALLALQNAAVALAFQTRARL